VSKPVDGEYGEPENLGEGVNGEGHEIDPFVSPDESYIIFLRRPNEDFELFISFRKDDVPGPKPRIWENRLIRAPGSSARLLRRMANISSSPAIEASIKATLIHL